MHFNPRSSCEEQLTSFFNLFCVIPYFNPRSSCEERHDMRSYLRASARISIHAPHASSDLRAPCGPWSSSHISIHAPHARSDAMSSMLSAFSILFQSTLLMRGATPTHGRLHYHRPISIHAPHARSDRRIDIRQHDAAISIHAPHARSDVQYLRQEVFGKFQSTLLMRGATLLDVEHFDLR